MTTPHSSSEPAGLSLPSRRANVTVTRRRSSIQSEEGDDAVGPLGRDSLEGTRRYYGVEASPQPNPDARARKVSSTASAAQRPLSQTPSESSFYLRSPPRSGSVPLPIPRGFLAPQKPAAARRLEQRERSTTVSTTGRASTDVRMSGEFGSAQQLSSMLTPALSTTGGERQYGTPTSTHQGEFNFGLTRPGTATADSDLDSNDHVEGLGLSTFPAWGQSRSTTPSASVPRGPSPAVSAGAGPNGSNKRLSGIMPRVPSLRRPSAPRRDTTPQPIAQPPTPTRTTDSGHGHGHAEHIWEGTGSSSPSHGTHGLPQDLSSDHLVDLKALTLSGEKRSPSDTLTRRSGGRHAQQLPMGAQHTTNVRNYKLFETRGSTFFCGGRMMTGGDTPWSFILSIILHLGVSGVWLGTTGAWLCVKGNEYGMARGGGIAVTVIFCYLFLTSLSSMVAAAFREPGILPRGLDPDPPLIEVDVYMEAKPREILVGEGGKDRVQCKYCETCKSYRPPRCSHCRLCGNCVEGIDHHCAYLHGCVGRRNYFAFLVFVIVTAIASIYIVVFSAVHFSMLCYHDHINFKTALGRSPGAAVSFLIGVLVLPPILFLLWYHLRLLLYNLTTIEQIRASASSNLFRATQRPYNPFAAQSRWQNIVRASIGRPQFPSWIDASGYHVEDERKVNPALTTAEKYLELV